MTSLRGALRIAVIATVALACFLAQREISRMDRVFFRASVSGVKGLALYLAGRYDDAANAYRAHWAAQIADGATTGDPGTDLILGGDLGGAERLAQAELRRTPNAVPAILLLAEAALERGAPDEASRFAARALALSPDDVDAAVMWSLARARAGAAGEAIDAINRALRSGGVGTRLLTFYEFLETTGTLGARPTNARPLCLLAHYHRYLRAFDRGQGRPAARYAREAIAAGDHVADAYLTLGVLSEKAGRTDDALAAFLAAIRVDPRLAEAYRWAAVIYGDRGDLVNEYRMISAALEVSGDVFYSEPFFDVAVNKVGDPARAAALLEPLVARAPTNARLRERLGHVWALLGDERRALPHYRQAVALAPDDMRAQNAMGWALRRLGKTSEAAVTLKRAAAIAPRWPEPHRQLAEIYYQDHHYPEAIAEAQTALRLGDRSVHLHTLLCNLYHYEVDLDRAESCLRDLLARDPGNVLALALMPKIRHEASLR